MNYYGDARFDRIKELVDKEVKEGTLSLRASYLSRKYELPVPPVQQVLSDLAAAGDLQTHYQLLCSGPMQRLDPDREFTEKTKIPIHEITCHQCGDSYVPSEENILLSFEPTKSYLFALGLVSEQ